MTINPQPIILQVLPALEQGGVERGTVEIDHALTASGWGSVVVSSGGRLVAQLKGKHIKLPLKTKNPVRILRNVRQLRKIIRDNNITIVHARSRAPAWSAYMAAKAEGVKFVTTFHGTYGIGSGLKRKYNSIMVKGEKIIAVSEFIRSHIIKNYNIAPEKIITIHRGADLTKFNSAVKPIGLGLPPGKVVMLPGRITRWKGQHIFIEAMKGMDATGVIVGDSASPAYMRELEEILTDNIIILPGTPDLPPVLANADIVVSASIRPEAFGRIAVEAQAMGKPVVTTNIGGALETVVNGQTGIHVPPNDVEAMRKAIIELLSKNEAMKPAYIKNAAKFSTAVMCEKTLEVYRSLIGS